jgi:hypothetical protein
MADYTAELDGSMTLDQTKSRCVIEQGDGFQLQKIRFKQRTEGNIVLLLNEAEFMSKPIGRLKNLLFVPVGANDPETLKRQKVEAEKWTFICDEQIYVQDNITRVMVFGKRKL